MGVHWKIRLLGGGVHEKMIQRGEIASKGGAWTVYKFKEVTWQERGRWCFWGEGGEWYPDENYAYLNLSSFWMLYTTVNALIRIFNILLI